METKMFEDIVVQWKAYSDYIYLHVLGEPLLHPELDALLGIADKYEMKVTITTNGSLLKEKVDILKCHKSIRQINISIHNFKEQNIDQDVYIRNSLDVGHDLSQQGIYVNYRFWNQRDGLLDKDTKEILSVFEKEFDIQFTGKKEKLGEYEYIHFDEVFEWPSLSSPYIGDRGKCLGTRSQLGVLVDGSVIPCCLDSNKDVLLGNVKTQTLNEVLGTSRYLNMKKGFEDNKVREKLCQHCSFRLRF